MPTPAAARRHSLLAPVIGLELLMLTGDPTRTLADPPPVAQPITFSLNQLAESTPMDRFVTSLVTDNRGGLWAASEGGGVRRFDPAAKPDERWTHYTVVDGLGDQNVYALAVDRKGRVWAGHLNHGVSVFNGERWQNYDVVAGADRTASLAGPLGERVFNIKVCPTDGDVWMATNAGLARYSESGDVWTYITRADGLPSDATDSIAFDDDGNIFVGTPADGIAMADAVDHYTHWRTVTCTCPTALTPTATGQGLPTNQINDVMCTHNGIVYAATTSGLAWSADRGKTWSFAHGSDWVERWKKSSAGLPADWKNPDSLLIDNDFITSLAQDKFGSIYLGYGHEGVGKFTHDADGTPQRDPGADNADNGTIVRALPPEMSQYVVSGTYGQGVMPMGDQATVPGNPPEEKAVAMPSGAAVPKLADLVTQLPTRDEEKPDALAIPLDDDWRTQGAWVGRYGRDWAFQAGMDIGGYQWGAGVQPTRFHTHVGPHVGDTPGERWYIASLYSTEPRAPEIPPVYYDSRLKKKLTKPGVDRRVGEVNDAGYAHPAAWEGPDLYNCFSIPDGTFVLSVYELNDDGHKGANGLRDYTVEIHTGHGSFDSIEAAAPVAVSRTTDFYNGVYKKFLITGPADVSVVLRKNGSNVTKLCAILLDQPTDLPTPYFADQPARPAMSASPAAQFDSALRELPAKNPKWWAIHHHRLAVLLARACQSAAPSTENSWQLASAYYFAGIFPKLETTQSALGLRTARDIEKSLTWQEKYPNNSGQEARDLKDYFDSLKKNP